MSTKPLIALIALMIALTPLLSCQTDRKPDHEMDKAADTEAPPPSALKTADGELTIFSWWTAGGEADGLAEHIRLFQEKSGGVSVVNAAVAGGAGTNAKAVLKTRMLGGDPPGTFQVHGGSELIDTWVKSGMMAALDSLYDEKGWRGKFPDALIDMVSWQGRIYAVPSNIHWGNALWCNKAVFEKNGLTPPETMEQFFAVCEKLQKAGVTPLALASRNKWPVLHLFENLLAASGGRDFYMDLFAGKAAWDDDRVKKALENFKKILEYVNADHAALTWDQACGLVGQGKAAMTVMGDWARGYFVTQSLKPGEDFDAVATPGTKGLFFVITDTFGMPENAPNKVATKLYLSIVGSVEGQLAFNLKKGSIPARTDVPTDAFDPIAKKTMEYFASANLLPSAAHGSAVIEDFVVSLNDQLSVFLSEKDVDKCAGAFAFAANDAGLKKD